MFNWNVGLYNTLFKIDKIIYNQLNTKFLNVSDILCYVFD